MKIKLAAVVAMSENRCIGQDNVMPWHISGDLKRVKAITMGKPCIMGRKTFQSILSYLNKPLPGRTSIVVSRGGFAYDADNVIVVPDIESAVSAARDIAARDNQDEVIVFGGAQIYESLLSRLDRIHLTLVHGHYEGDAYFPAIDKDGWRETTREDHEGDPSYSFLTLERA